MPDIGVIQGGREPGHSSPRRLSAGVVASLVLYACSFVVPVSLMPAGVMLGWQAFLGCMYSIVWLFSDRDAVPFFLAWCANPINWAGIGLFAIRRYSLALSAGIVSVLLGNAALYAFPVYRYPGFWVWLAAFAVFSISAAPKSLEHKVQTVDWPAPRHGAIRPRPSGEFARMLFPRWWR